MARPFTVIAIISAHNEGDIIAQVMGHLVSQGMKALLLDDGSTDSTVTEAEAFLGRGLLAIERLPPLPAFSWERILKRKEELGHATDADWLIHHDADEFRESPWQDETLLQAIERVDRLGYNAIDFAVLNFQPTDDSFVPGSDPRAAFPFFEWGKSYDKLQIKCWKKRQAPVDLCSSGGHEAVFPGRRVFPLRFVLRHYPLRSQAHAERKVEKERRARFLPAELARGWHRQYESLGSGPYVRDPEDLIRYDAESVRHHLLLHHRGVEEAALEPALQIQELDACRREKEVVSRELHRKNHEAARLAQELDAQNHEAARLAQELDAQNHEAARLAQELDARNREVARLCLELDARNGEIARLTRDVEGESRRVAELRASWSFRVTAPARAALRLLRGY